MKKIETLEDWITDMMQSNKNALISNRTSINIMEILNGNNTNNYIVFDNAGGMQFAVWKVDNEKSLLEFKNSLRVDLLHGYVLNGKSTLCEYQKEYPHWDLNKKSIKFKL